MLKTVLAWVDLLEGEALHSTSISSSRVYARSSEYVHHVPDLGSPMVPFI